MNEKAKRKLSSLGVATMAELKGRRVRLKRRLETVGGTVFEAGVLLEVYGTWRGRLNLKMIESAHDGSHPGITHVALWDIENPGVSASSGE